MPDRKWIQRVGPFIAVALAAAGGLILETITPEIISATIFYVVVVLTGYWFPQSKSALALALLTTALIIIGDWISIPNGPFDWKVLLNRCLAIGVVWLVAFFVWYTRVLEQKLQAGKDHLQSALERLGESEERMRFIADRAHIGYWDWQIATDRVEWSPINNQLLGIPPEDPMSYERFLAAVHPDDRERTDRAVRACLESGGQKDYDVEFRTLWPAETVRWIRGKGNATFEDGKPVRMAGLALDVTERKQHEEREHLLVREMNHRVKNILAVVDAIAQRTAAESPEDFGKRFSERIRALSANQDLLFRNEWKGVDVEELVRAQLSHLSDLIGSRIILDGPKLRFNTAGAQTIGLALHELATNAGKYGALSTDRGRVDLRWNFSDNAFTMSWTERGGPSVSAPKRCGFGTTVIERMAKSSLRGTVDLDYAPSGLTWCLTCPAGNALERRI
jgi:PAS domain S-box-containing protein